MVENTTPHQWCRTCHRRRACRLHLRAEFPPAAARRWLQRSCPWPREGRCQIIYQVALLPLLPEEER
jgi:hypothetical protein